MADIPNDVDAKVNDNKDHDSKEKYIDTVNTEDPDYQRELIRPAVIKEDMKEMERRKRVSLILNSQAFREELEQIVESQIKTGPHPASLIALQQISELLLPQSRFNQTSSAGPALGRGYSAVTPIADIRGLDSQNYTKGEKIVRCKLASLYRVLDIHGWTHSIYNHVSVRISHEADHFLVNPFGLLYHEISASSLIKIDMQGNTVDPGTTNYPANKSGWSLHAAIHSTRPAIKCIIELHTPAAAAVSCMKCGLLRCCDEACVLGDISYHDFTGMIVDKNDRDSITRALGPNNKVLVQRNHGILVCGETIEEAYYLALNAMTACETQIKLLTCSNIDDLILVDEAMSKKAKEIASIGIPKSDDKRKWRIGELEFEAMMRWLDNMGHRTGYIYHQPLIKVEDKKKFSDVTIPPASTSFTYVHEGDVESSKYEPPMKMAQRRAAGEKTKWLTTPNTYTKVEVTINEGDEGSPKTKTKWVTKEEATEGETMKIQDPQQFAKQGEDPKEFKKRQKEIKQDRRDDKIHAGPISEVLSGVGYPGSRLQDAKSSGSGDNVQAASKGIIQRDFQKEAIVYTTYSPNPFEGMSEKEILKYKEEVANKTGQDLSDIQFPVEELEKEESTKEDVVMEETSTETVTRKEGDQEIVTTVTTVKKTVIETDIDAEPEKGGEESRTSTLEHEKDDSSKESSPTKETSPKKKEKEKKKKGFRTPSFLKKKDKKGKGDEEE
ncbi:alpha-adducin-like isoform X2 [Ptychodera flava]|uniref:alpha-adducin-like isoform X2 n=1 Tax=Ptychodera flava TaxID=63121 RepID=UPI00396A12AA